MKSRMTLRLLCAAVAIVWGIVAWKILKPRPHVCASVGVRAPSAPPANEDDTLHADYPDPFLKEPAELAVPINFGDAFDAVTDLAAFHARYSTFVHNCVGMRVGCMQTTSQTERIFEADGSVRTRKTEYFYDNADLYYRPTRTRVEEWNGEATLRYRFFAPDYADGGMADTLAAMRRGNVVDKPVEEFVVRNGAVVEAALYAYDVDGDIVRSYRLKEPGMPLARFRASNQATAGAFAAPPTAFDPDYSAYER